MCRRRPKRGATTAPSSPATLSYLRAGAEPERDRVLLAAADERPDVLEEARAVGLQLVGEEVPRGHCLSLFNGRRPLAFTGTSHFPPHLAVDPVDNLSQAPPAAAPSSALVRDRGQSTPRPDPSIPLLGDAPRTPRKERKKEEGHSWSKPVHDAARSGSGACNRTPDALLLEHEPVLVHDELGLELVLRVEVAVLPQPCSAGARARPAARASGARRRRSRPPLRLPAAGAGWGACSSPA